MDYVVTLPKDINDYICGNFGHIEVIKSLKGIKSQGGCYRVQGQGYSVIAKFIDNPVEALFYLDFLQRAEVLRRYAPKLDKCLKAENRQWIILEDIPYALPRERWVNDSEAIEVLYAFHSFTYKAKMKFEYKYHPAWNDSFTYDMDRLLEEKLHINLKRSLYGLQQEAQSLFMPICNLHGDTNPTNWGIREHGELVLFDWERITAGHPAIDLAITLPGYGSLDGRQEEELAQKYLLIDMNRDNFLKDTLAELTRKIRIAKLWSIIEFLLNVYNNGQAKGHEGILEAVKERVIVLSK